ncbi:MAG TPA: cobyrinate a,c-diamide synthase [Candidatus Binataceae bacterium]|nr:cobyrinate a,c-diamide synthase [Candidatus Binataceae bacterium]
MIESAAPRCYCGAVGDTGNEPEVLRPAPSAVTVPRLVIAGTESSAGKTTFSVGLIRALRARGLKVAVFKCGPDYLDPSYHSRAAGLPSHNLDGWMMGHDAVLATFARASAGADIAVIEGVMGLFDGASARGEDGSTAQIAKWLGAPVLLVVDASAMARTIAAIGLGFRDFDPDLHLAGLICNRVGSKGHLELLREACEEPPVLGAMPHDASLSFPERHLGLLTADERAVPEKLLSAWGEVVREWCDLDAITALARHSAVLPAPRPAQSGPARRSKCTIGVAMDEAFHFYYLDNLTRLEEAGAELVMFSPLHDSRPPRVNGLYFGGGYPEVYAAQLGANASMRCEVAAYAAAGGVIYAECGGLMYLCAELRTLDGGAYPMCGVVPARTVMCDRLQALGYVEVQTRRPSIIGGAGTRFRGHQFRYSRLEPLSSAIDPAFRIVRRYGGDEIDEGFQIDNTIASYVHAHWASNAAAAEALVKSCAGGTR